MKEKISKDIYDAIQKLHDFCMNYICDFCPLYTHDIECPCVLFEEPRNWIDMIKYLKIDVVENNEEDNEC